MKLFNSNGLVVFFGLISFVTLGFLFSDVQAENRKGEQAPYSIDMETVADKVEENYKKIYIPSGGFIRNNNCEYKHGTVQGLYGHTLNTTYLYDTNPEEDDSTYVSTEYGCEATAALSIPLNAIITKARVYYATNNVEDEIEISVSYHDLIESSGSYGGVSDWARNVIGVVDTNDTLQEYELDVEKYLPTETQAIYPHRFLRLVISNGSSTSETAKVIGVQVTYREE